MTDPTSARPILVPLDGSLLAETALPWAAFLAQRWSAPLTLLRVAEYPHYGAISLADASLTMLGLDTEQEIADAYLKERADALRASHPTLDVRTACGIGDPTTNILSLERESGVQLVVLSTHGRTGLIRWALGSVAEKIVHHGGTPVLLVRPWDQASAISRLQRLDNAGLRVLVPLDGSSLAQGVLPLAASLATGDRGELILTSVIRTEDERAIGPYYQPRTSDLRHEARQYLAHISTTPPVNSVSSHAVVGIEHDVAGAIVDLASLEAADVIALSTHGRGALGRLLHGSIADRIAHAARVPVLLYRPQSAQVVQTPPLQPAVAQTQPLPASRTPVAA